ncbi:Hypothetical protein TART1_2349 [Trichococcus shcherbakoviae]|uniref:NADP-dependent oxidoreductase domain-containing protein n=1 Tax=Trichococcus shcherbakoviae TaxID=2094020 RepID=A0A383THS2_9LACT|nr:Hypothetical protein TART1_2349 [Trichococcus shcherbakoviae]
MAKHKYDTTEAQDRVIVERVAAIAEKYGVERVQVALSWLLQKDQVVAPIIGATKESHLTSAISALDFKLSAEDILSLEEPYIPHHIMGHN